MKKMGLILIYLSLVYFCSCQKEVIEYEQGNVKICIEQGEEWLHNFPLFLGIKKKNPPQVAIWIEDLEGNYLSTIYVTHKIATQSWQSAGGNRRKESLPHWCYTRGIKYEDGLYLPTKNEPLTDGISGATPRGSFNIKLIPANALKKFIVKVEINHSTDFNTYYPESAKEGEANYSGGKLGSGQPAVIYSATIDLSSDEKSFEANLIGHSSPDGSSGNIYKDTSGLTTALHIVKHITVNIQ